MYERVADGLVWFRKQAFGSDELTAYTAEYTWNANQMAHAMMGFALAAIWLRMAIARWERYHPLETAKAAAAGEVAAVAVVVVAPTAAEPTSWFRPRHWLCCAWRSLDFSTAVLFALIPLKDFVDYLLDTANYATSPVPPSEWPIVFDSITDVTFWWTGMFAGAVLIGGFYRKELRGWVRTLIPIVGFAACLGFGVWYAAPTWLDQKRTFDESGLPFNYTRLAVLAGQKPKDAEIVFDDASPVKWPQLAEFRDAVSGSAPPTPRHYVILGGTPAQRSKLAVSMGCEYALALRKPRPAEWVTDYDKADAGGKAALEKLLLRRVRYVTAAAAQERAELFQESLHRAVVECIVIDDLSVATHLDEPTRGKVAAVFDSLPPSAQVPSAVARRVGLPADYARRSADEKRALVSPAEKPQLSQEEFGEQKRRLKYEALGELVRDQEIGTVWVLTGDRTLPQWQENAKRWLGEIAQLTSGADEPTRHKLTAEFESLCDVAKNRPDPRLGVVVLQLPTPVKAPARTAK